MDAHELYYGHGTDNALSEAQWLLVAVLTAAGAGQITEQMPIAPDQLAQMEALLARRINERIPLAYLLGEAWFAGHCFYVDDRVLVPRSPIAELVVNRFEPLLANSPDAILDLCCGSGCIGIACALAFPESRVVLADISTDALAVAAVNIERFGLQDRVTTLQSDLYAAIPGRFDLVLSNPPYVPESEYRDLPGEYRQEPAIGLVTAQDGLEIPLRILAESGRHLNPAGTLILETGATWMALADAVPGLPCLWLDFEFGGEGVCLLSAQQLQTHYPTNP